MSLPSPVRRALVGAAGVLLVAAGLGANAPAATADGPGTGSPWVVTVGDSYISGEAGRWAGNSNSSTTAADAGGPSAYYDNAGHTAETIDRCHRSQAAEAYLGGGVNGMNLACSGARTSTFTNSSGYFKPGLDFSDDGAGHQGQAKLLQDFATSHNVKVVAVSIGGNDFNFGDVVQTCVTDFLGSSSLFPDYCNDDSSVTANFTAANVSAVRAKIATAFSNVRTAMRNAGYADGSWTLLVQNYPSPLPNGSGIRYSESGYTRQSTGGCGFWNADADWANGTALATINSTVAGALGDAAVTGAKSLDLASAFNGRRLCENTVGLLEEKGLSSWTQAGAVDQTEWINQIRTVSTVSGPYFVQESLHPNYWAQLALRSCVRQAYNGGTPKGGSCSISGTGLVNGEPKMTLR